jgi:hypothetical protein
MAKKLTKEQKQRARVKQDKKILAWYRKYYTKIKENAIIISGDEEPPPPDDQEPNPPEE